MSFLDLFVIAVGLSMDAFAVSVCKGLSVRQLKFSHAWYRRCVLRRLSVSDAAARLCARRPVPAVHHEH